MLVYNKHLLINMHSINIRVTLTGINFNMLHYYVQKNFLRINNTYGGF